MANWIVERVERYVRECERDPERVRVVAEGDSWFSFPAGFWKGRKLISWLRDQDTLPLHVASFASPGDTLYKMAYGGSGDLDLAFGLIAEAHVMPDVVLLSAGGNDFFRRVPDVVPYRDPPHLDADVLAQLLDDMRQWYVDLVAKIRRHSAAPIVVHGYDYVIPIASAQKILGIFPVGPWLFPHLEKLGLSARAKREVTRQLVDAFNDELLARLPDVVHLDLRGTLTRRSDFADEIHPSEAGMEKLTARFVAKIDEVTAR